MVKLPESHLLTALDIFQDTVYKDDVRRSANQERPRRKHFRRRMPRNNEIGFCHYKMPQSETTTGRSKLSSGKYGSYIRRYQLTRQNMIAAYTSTHTASCARCGKLLDNHALTPAARRSRISTSPDGAQSTIWDAIHESCL